MAHAQNPDFVFRRNGRIHLNRRGRQFIRLLATEVCVSAVVMLDISCSMGVWRVLATHSIRQFPLHFPSRASPCAITFQLDSTTVCIQHLVLIILFKWLSVVLVGLEFKSNQNNRQSSKKNKIIISINCCIHTFVPPDDGSRYARNMQRLTKLRISWVSSWFFSTRLVSYTQSGENTPGR